MSLEEISAGIIPYRYTRNKIEYLILKSRTSDWEFPKGNIENDEELQECALRELKEEANINEVKILDGFKEEYEYTYYRKGKEINKTVHLFIGKSFSANADLSSEHSDYQWREYQQAYNTLTHEEVVDILKQADEFIRENYNS